MASLGSIGLYPLLAPYLGAAGARPEKGIKGVWPPSPKVGSIPTGSTVLQVSHMKGDVMGKSGVILIKEFFSTEKRPVGMDELKALTAAERGELADAIAAQQGLTKQVVGGQTQYLAAA